MFRESYNVIFYWEKLLLVVEVVMLLQLKCSIETDTQISVAFCWVLNGCRGHILSSEEDNIQQVTRGLDTLIDWVAAGAVY